MKTDFAWRRTGAGKIGEVSGAIFAGVSPVVVAASVSAATLSASARELVRGLRAAGARTEFHSPGDDAGALLQSVNRLLVDIPLESLRDSADDRPPHLLVIDDAEGLSSAETAALKRVANGLRGSALRILLLTRVDATELVQLALSDLGEIAGLWDIDGSADEASAAGSAAVGNELAAVPAANEGGRTARASVAIPPGPRAEIPIPDVLAELAQERAAALGLDVTQGRRRTSSIVAGTAVALGLLLVVFIAYEIWATRPQALQNTFDCGLHPDRESVDVLISRIPRTTPVRVIPEGGRLRLQVGPFPDSAATAEARAQLWRIGACSALPVTTPITTPITASKTPDTGG